MWGNLFAYYKCIGTDTDGYLLIHTSIVFVYFSIEYVSYKIDVIIIHSIIMRI